MMRRCVVAMSHHHSLAGRLGGLSLASSRDPRDYTAAGRAAFLRRFEEAVDPRNELQESERLRRAEALRRLYFSRLAYQSAKAQRRQKRRQDGTKGGGDE